MNPQDKSRLPKDKSISKKIVLNGCAYRQVLVLHKLLVRLLRLYLEEERYSQQC